MQYCFSSCDPSYYPWSQPQSQPQSWSQSQIWPSQPQPQYQPQSQSQSWHQSQPQHQSNNFFAHGISTFPYNYSSQNLSPYGLHISPNSQIFGEMKIPWYDINMAETKISGISGTSILCCSQCSSGKIRCSLCGWIHCPIHEPSHDSGVAEFSAMINRDSHGMKQSTIDKLCHSNSGKFKYTGYYFCPAPGCQKLAFSKCQDNICCGFFCPDHVSHDHFKCSNNSCNKLGKVRKDYPNDMIKLYCSDKHYYQMHRDAFGKQDEKNKE